MRVRFYASEGKEREEAIGRALALGCARFNDFCDTKPTASFEHPEPEIEVALAFGVKGHTQDILGAYQAAGKRTIMVDKAFIRVPGAGAGYFRTTIDVPSPNPGLMRILRPLNRFEALRIDVRPRREPGGAIVYAGSSQKYCDWHGLGEANEYAASVINACRQYAPKREIIYRPKPTWPGAREIDGTTFSQKEALTEILDRAHVLVTHGSSAAVDAIIYGVPAVCLGDCAASPVTGNHPAYVKVPIWPSDHAREHWLGNLAWWQWTLEEFRSGEAWQFLKAEIAA